MIMWRMKTKKIYVNKLFIILCIALTYLILEDNMHTTEKIANPVSNLSKLM